jgi:hypothetical protein
VNGAGETFSNSDSAVIIPNGIRALSTDIESISLYPNPTADYTKLSIWSSISGPATVSVIDMEGSEFYSKAITFKQGKNDLILNILGISAGIYMVNLQCNNSSYSKRLVIVK